MSSLTQRFTDCAAGAVSASVDRRSFLVRSAVAGGPLVVAPSTYLLRPTSAFNAAGGTRNVRLGTRTVDVRSEPFRHLEAVEPVPGGLRVSGWAIDPDTADPRDEENLELHRLLARATTPWGAAGLAGRRVVGAVQRRLGTIRASRGDRL